MSYEIFISYSRKDDLPQTAGDVCGWVTALREFIAANHRQYSTDPLRVFFDTSAIVSMDDWRDRILQGLRESQILLVCLSPNYYGSEHCKWEFEEYVHRQIHRLVGHEGFATVYFEHVPRPAEHLSDGDWSELLDKPLFVDLRHWFRMGTRALQEDAVRQSLTTLGTSLWDRIQRTRRAASVPGNLRRLNPHFIGRRNELAQLHAKAGRGTVGVITAVHGLGGMGKTELALAYAHGFSDCYTAGLWVLAAEGKNELLPLFGDLCASLGIPQSAGDNESSEQRGRRVIAELMRRALETKHRDSGKSAACLVILDNVSEPALLSEPQIASLPRENWLCIVATTRLGEPSCAVSGKNSLAFVTLDSLDEDDAARLIQDHQNGGCWPVATAESDIAAAREIGRELGGFTLAIETVAIYLGLNPEVRPAEYLSRLREEGLPAVDDLSGDGGVAMQMQHREKQLRIILDQTLGKLEPIGLSALEYAALLPPDEISWWWLLSLLEEDYPNSFTTRPGYPDPSSDLERRLHGLRLLVPADESRATARMHRLVSADLQRRMIQRGPDALPSRRAKLEDFVIAQVKEILRTLDTEEGSRKARLLPHFVRAVRHWRDDPFTASNALHTIFEIAEYLIRFMIETLEKRLAADPSDWKTAKTLCIDCNSFAFYLRSGGPREEQLREADELESRAWELKLKYLRYWRSQ